MLRRMDEHEFQDVALALVQYARSVSARQTALENIVKARLGITTEELSSSVAQAKDSLSGPSYTATPSGLAGFLQQLSTRG